MSQEVSQRPDEFSYEMEAERVRWLRKRFLWFCAVSLVLMALPMLTFFTPTNRKSLSGAAGPAMQAAMVLGIVVALGSVTGYVWAFIYALRSHLSRSRMIGLALLLTVTLHSVSLLASRLQWTWMWPFMQTEMLLAFDEGVKKGRHPPSATSPAPGITIQIGPNQPAADPATNPTTSQATARAARGEQMIAKLRGFIAGIRAAEFWAVFVACVSIFISQLLPCLFIPWTFRESMRPALAMLIVATAIMLLDVSMGWATPWTLLMIVPDTLAVIPGSAWCWWRYSRFRKRFHYRFVSSRYDTIQSELEQARRMHESSLPAPIVVGPIQLQYVYEPMRQIGGDLLYVPRDRSSPLVLSVVMLDVTGHGIAAALTVNRLVGELDRIFADDPDVQPSAVICALNHYVNATLARLGLYVTAVCIRADAGAEKLEWASGGHPTAFLIRRSGEIVELESTALILGVQDQKDYVAETGRVEFRAGDAVIGYTDGAAEARNHRGVALGTAGVREMVASIASRTEGPGRIPDSMMRGVLDYRGTPPDDDTLVAAIFRPGES